MKVIAKVGSVTLKLIAVAVTILLLLSTLIYLVKQILDGHSIIWPLVGLWALVAYIILPRIHRFLTKIYLPNYFIGRTRTGDGLYSDPVNIAFVGGETDLHDAMKAAGWVRADDLSMKSSLKMIRTSVRKKSYPNAPVSSLYLFSEQQDFAYQQEINNNPRKRHHIRFWRVPKGWYLPGGYEVDWLAAATYDKHVGLSLYTGQVTHKIAEDTDEERDFVVGTLNKTNKIKKVTYIKHFTTAFRDRNGGGDAIQTDGSLPFVILHGQHMPEIEKTDKTS